MDKKLKECALLENKLMWDKTRQARMDAENVQTAVDTGDQPLTRRGDILRIHETVRRVWRYSRGVQGGTDRGREG